MIAISARIGPYDDLYEAAGRLWPDTPGRMVVRAAEAIAKPVRTLDLGCGDGKNMAYLERLGWTVDGVDLSPVACAEAARRRAESGASWQGRIICSDVTTIAPARDRKSVV